MIKRIGILKVSPQGRDLIERTLSNIWWNNQYKYSAFESKRFIKENYQLLHDLMVIHATRQMSKAPYSPLFASLEFTFTDSKQAKSHWIDITVSETDFLTILDI